MKENKNSNMKAIKDFILSKEFLILIALSTFGVDLSASQPFYEYIMDDPKLGNILAFGMALTLALLPKITAKILAGNHKQKKLLSLIGIALGGLLITLIYFAQVTLMEVALTDPWMTAMGGEIPTKSTSNRHIIITALSAILYAIGVFIGYLYYSEYYNKNPKSGLHFQWTAVLRTLKAKLFISQALYERAAKKTNSLAEKPVLEKIAACEEIINEQNRKLAQENLFYKFQLEQIKNTEEQIQIAIEKAYKRKSFFNFLKF
jgi:hypothetical protein